MKIGVRCNPLVLKEDFKGLVEWLAENGFDAVDLMSPDPDAKAACDAAGIGVGSFDAPSLRHILTDDEEARSKAAEKMKDSFPPGFLEVHDSMMVFKRREQPSDLVGAAVYFASDDSDFVTGQSLVIDGGMTMH